MRKYANREPRLAEDTEPSLYLEVKELLQRVGNLERRYGSGLTVLSSGTGNVMYPAITATSPILLTVQQLGTVTVPKALAVVLRTPGVGFTIVSSDPTDTSTVAWYDAVR